MYEERYSRIKWYRKENMQLHHSGRRFLGGLSHRGITDQPHIVIKLKSSLRVILALNKFHNQRVLNSEHRVVGKVLVLAVEDLGSQRAVAVTGSLERIIRYADLES